MSAKKKMPPGADVPSGHPAWTHDRRPAMYVHVRYYDGDPPDPGRWGPGMLAIHVMSTCRPTRTLIFQDAASVGHPLTDGAIDAPIYGLGSIILCHIMPIVPRHHRLILMIDDNDDDFITDDEWDAIRLLNEDAVLFISEYSPSEAVDMLDTATSLTTFVDRVLLIQRAMSPGADDPGEPFFLSDDDVRDWLRALSVVLADLALQAGIPAEDLAGQLAASIEAVSAVQSQAAN